MQVAQGLTVRRPIHEIHSHDKYFQFPKARLRSLDCVQASRRPITLAERDTMVKPRMLGRAILGFTILLVAQAAPRLAAQTTSSSPAPAASTASVPATDSE